MVAMLITVLEGKTELSDKVKEEEVKTDAVQSIQIMQQKKGVYIAYILLFVSPSSLQLLVSFSIRFYSCSVF